MNQAHVQLSWLAAVWPTLKDYVPLLAVVIAVVIPLSASFFGAWTAQRIAERNRFRDEVVKEIRNTNAAISLAFAVCNACMALKRQHLLKIKADFDSTQKDFVEHLRKRQTGEIQGNAEYRFTLGLMTLTLPKLPTESLRTLVLDRVSAVNRPLHLVVEIVQSDDTLRMCLERRNEQIEEVKKTDGLNEKGSAQRFFGLPFDGGHVDQSVEQVLQAIVQTNDNLIYFAYLLCKDLMKHGDGLVAKYKERLGDTKVPSITSIDFSGRIADGTVPPATQFIDWETNFVTRKLPPTRWQRIRHPIASRQVEK